MVEFYAFKKIGNPSDLLNLLEEKWISTQKDINRTEKDRAGGLKFWPRPRPHDNVKCIDIFSRTDPSQRYPHTWTYLNIFSYPFSDKHVPFQVHFLINMSTSEPTSCGIKNHPAFWHDEFFHKMGHGSKWNKYHDDRKHNEDRIWYFIKEWQHAFYFLPNNLKGV